MNNANSAKPRKTSKKDLLSAYQSFTYSLASLTGGTSQEVLKQAPHGILYLEKLAAEVAALAANPAKPCAGDSWLMNNALVSVPERLESYRARYVTGQAEKLENAAPVAAERRAQTAAALVRTVCGSPENIIFHNFAA